MLHKKIIIYILLVLGATRVSAQEEITPLNDPQDYAKAVTTMYRNNEWAGGKKLVTEGLKKYAEDSDLKRLLGRFYLERQSYDSARYELLKSLEYNVNNTDAKQLLIRVETQTQRYSSAICYVNELLEITPYNKELWISKINIYRQEGNTVEANRLLTRLCQIYPEDKELQADYLYYIEQEVIAMRNEGDMRAAIEMATMLTEKNPYNEGYHLELINNYLKTGNYQAALESAEKGLFYLPGNVVLIGKKADILGGMYLYDQALDFLHAEMKKADSKDLQTKYQYLLETSARFHRKNDTYSLYSDLFRHNPRNREAFNYALYTAIDRGLYEDALATIATAKATNSYDPKELLLKERLVYVSMGRNAKADQVMEQLYQHYPADADILAEYIQLRMRSAKAHIDDGRYSEALTHLQFVAEHGDEEQVKAALITMFNCNHQLGRNNDALAIADRIVRDYPDEWQWYGRRAAMYGSQKQYRQALDEYEKGLQYTPPVDRQRVLDGYDELAAACVKDLMDDYQFAQATPLVEHWLEVNPASMQGLRYAIGLAAQTGDYPRMEQYAVRGLEHYPNNEYFTGKWAEAISAQKKYRQSFDLLTPQIAGNPHHKGLVAAYTQAGEGYARQLIRETKYSESLGVLDSTLMYDPANRDLKYWKGIAYEKLRVYDSAYVYQAFNESLTEARELENHRRYLKYKTYKNLMHFGYMRGKYGDNYTMRSMAWLGYSRIEPNNTYSGTVNYTGREDGKGVQGLFDWMHQWCPDFHTTVTLGAANKYFPNALLSVAAGKSFANEWEAELGAGYRRFETNNYEVDASGEPVVANTSSHNMFNITGGVAKTWEPWWLNLKVSGFVSENQWYYSVFAQGRYYLQNPATSIVAMGSFGSAPDVDVINYNLYDGVSLTNSMVGMGVNYLLSEKLSATLLGTWYNFKLTDPSVPASANFYRNLFNLSVQLNVCF